MLAERIHSKSFQKSDVKSTYQNLEVHYNVYIFNHPVLNNY